MRIRAVAAVLVGDEGQRWAVSGWAQRGGIGAVQVAMGYTDPEPVELWPGAQWMPPSEPTGAAGLAVSGVGGWQLERLPGLSEPVAASEGAAGVPGTPPVGAEAPEGAEGADPDGLAKLLAFRFGVPPVEGEGGWARLTGEQQGMWEAEADMVRGYLVHGLGWRAP